MLFCFVFFPPEDVSLSIDRPNLKSAQASLSCFCLGLQFTWISNEIRKSPQSSGIVTHLYGYQVRNYLADIDKSRYVGPTFV